MIVDTSRLSFKLSAQKIDSLESLLTQAAHTLQPSLRCIACVFNKLIWATTAVPFTRANFREIQRCFIDSAKKVCYDLKFKCILSKEARAELEWWEENLRKVNGKKFASGKPDLSIFSDALLSGWGGVSEGVTARGPWSKEDESQNCFDSSALDRSNLVPIIAGTSSRGSKNNNESSYIGARKSTSFKQDSSAPSRLEIIRHRLGRRGIPSQVVELIVVGNRSTTHVAYESAWNNWTDWCLARNADPLTNALMPHAKISIYPLVIKLLKGCYHQNPPSPRYFSLWNPEVVLNFVKRIDDSDALGLPSLSRKLATLLALATLMRTSELAAIPSEWNQEWQFFV
ncbi:Uncharacterized protein APZ42_021354 [Daphnia magna]|uniref:Tyr recombinase domain-containing protein n=1 Tax=Daphnia magna TaxID=35525 RepID=A0A162CAJ9_9CRUS|nr:Uncharacterized protein APZ42_021354 [Daphnia magna]